MLRLSVQFSTKKISLSRYTYTIPKEIKKHMEDQERLLTVNEFAKLTDKSRQAVYQQMSTCLKEYVKERQGHKYIEIRALKELYNMDIDKALQSMTSVKFVKPDKEKVSMTNVKFDKFVKDSDKEIKELKEQVKTLTEQLHSTEKELIEVKTREQEQAKLIEILQADKTKLNDIIDKMQEDNADVVTSLKQLTADNTKLQYQIQEYQQEQSRPGFLKRLFGKKNK